jgi:hypothetical protein
MIAVYIIYNNEYQDIKKYLDCFAKIKLPNNNKYIIGDNIPFTEMKNIKILHVDNKLLPFYTYKLFKNYTYCIELELDYNAIINVDDINVRDICTGYKIVNSLTDIFNENSLEKIKLINKNINFSLFNNKIINNFKIYNISSLHNNTFYENIVYIYEKFLSNNVILTNIQLFTIYQLLYPNYISYVLLETIKELIEEEVGDIINNNLKILDEKLDNNLETNLKIKINDSYFNYYFRNNIDTTNWYVIKKYFKIINNNTILSLQDTYIKKNGVKENKNDPYDKINLPIGRRLKLKNYQPFEYFYNVYFK